MRILAIAQCLAQPAGEGQARWKSGVSGEPRGDGGVIGGSHGIRLGRAAGAEGLGGAALGQGRQESVVLRGIGQHHHVIMVLGRRPDQRRAADVDVLDAIVRGGAGCDRGLEWIQVHADQIDRQDAVLGHLRQVIRIIPPAQNAAMDLRHQRLDPAAQYLRKAGMVRDLRHRDPGVPQHLGRAPGRDQRRPMCGQRPGQWQEPGLVRDGKEGAADRGMHARALTHLAHNPKRSSVRLTTASSV